MRVLGAIVRGLLAVLFLSAGVMKLAGGVRVVETFARLGFGQWFRIVVGLAEVGGALALVVPPLAPVAAIALAGLMLGAIASHLLVLGTATMAPAVVALVLCVVVAGFERDALASVRVLRSGKGPMDGWLARAYDRGVQAAFRDLFPVLARDVLDGLRDARRVLDAGCGPGQFTIIGAEGLPDAEVWGIDLAPTMIELARAHAAASPAGPRLHFEVADVARLPFPDRHFDAVFSSGSIKHWPDAIAGLTELHRVLGPGGRAFIAEINRLASPEAVATQAARMRGWVMGRLYTNVVAKGLSPDEAQRLFAASPFGPPVGHRMLLDGCLWLFELRKA